MATFRLQMKLYLCLLTVARQPGGPPAAAARVTGLASPVSCPVPYCWIVATAAGVVTSFIVICVLKMLKVARSRFPDVVMRPLFQYA